MNVKSAAGVFYWLFCCTAETQKMTAIAATTQLEARFESVQCEDNIFLGIFYM